MSSTDPTPVGKRLAQLFRFPNAPPMLSNDYEHLPCGCAVVAGLRVDNQEVMIAFNTCSAAHHGPMSRAREKFLNSPPDMVVSAVRASIEWCDHSINPVKFKLKLEQAVKPVLVNMCTKCSPGCRGCYAESLTRRWWPAGAKAEGKEFPGYAAEALKLGHFVIDDRKLLEVLRRREPTKFFWCDMTDLFHPSVPFDLVDQCFAVMSLTPQHIHQVLTKRPDRMAEYLTHRGRQDLITLECGILTGSIDRERPRVALRMIDAWKRRPERWWPLSNVWLGTSVENQEWANKRIREVLQCPAVVRFLSCEPLLGSLNLKPYLSNTYRTRCPGSVAASMPCIDWVIVGGESGAHARFMHPAWARSIRDQCLAAGVPFFFKQWGQFTYEPMKLADCEHDCCVDGDGGQWAISIKDDRVAYMGPGKSFWSIDHGALPRPDLVRWHYVGKKAAGRLLDGRQWSEFPKSFDYENFYRTERK